MKAIVIDQFVNNPTDLTISSIPSPTIHHPTEVLVTVHYAAINFVDLLYARGLHQNNTSLVLPPFTLGLEFAGTVADAAPSSRWRCGDRVFGAGLGPFAEQIVVNEDRLHEIPAGLNLAGAASLGATAPVSYGALVERGGLKAGETVLVHAGAGGLGVMAVQIAKALGARVIATAGSGEEMEVARRAGADVVVDYSVEGWEKAVVEASGGEGVDVVFDTVGLVGRSLRCLRHGGRALVVGFAGSDGVIEKVAMNRILLKQAWVIGYRYGETDRRDKEETKRVWSGLSQLIAQRLIKPVLYREKSMGKGNCAYIEGIKVEYLSVEVETSVIIIGQEVQASHTPICVASTKLESSLSSQGKCSRPTYTSNINQLCSTTCNSLNYNFFGTVNSAASPTSGDCYCGNALNFVSVLNVGTGMAPDNNCGTCNSGLGQCGILTSSTVAIYAPAF